MRSLPVFPDLRAFLGWAEDAGDLARPGRTVALPRCRVAHHLTRGR